MDPTRNGGTAAPGRSVSTSTARVVVVGESLVDEVTADAVVSRHPGGSPLNVAYGLGRLGLETTLVTSLGDDADGKMIREHLSRAGVSVITPGPRPARTGTAIAAVSASGDAEYAFDLTWELNPFRTPDARLVHTGSLALVLERGATRVRELVEASIGSALVSVDPNIRAAAVSDSARTRRELRATMAHADIVKLSRYDAQWLFDDGDEDRIADRLLAAGAKLVAVTGDARGSLVASTAARVAVRPRPVAVVDTVGAGDAYMSGLIAATLRHNTRDLTTFRGEGLQAATLAEIGEYASRVAALTVGRAGANPPTAAEVASAAGPHR